MGVDPGVNGGVAVLRLDGSTVFVAGLNSAMTHGDAVDVVEAAKDALRREGGGLCFCEKVGVMRHDGRKGANTFGRVDGILRGAILARPRVIIADVYPQAWQSALNCMTGGDKDVSLALARALFPSAFPPKATKALALRISDALLIAEYGRRWVSARPHLTL